MSDDHDPILGDHGARDYPETLRITVESSDAAFDRVKKQARSGSTDEAVRSFESVADVRQLLTDRRIETMKSIMTEIPASISDLADRLERNYADVHADVQVLADHHVVYFDVDGKSKRPVIPYGRIRIDVEVTGGEHGEESAPA